MRGVPCQHPNPRKATILGPGVGWGGVLGRARCGWVIGTWVLLPKLAQSRKAGPACTHTHTHTHTHTVHVCSHGAPPQPQ